MYDIFSCENKDHSIKKLSMNKCWCLTHAILAMEINFQKSRYCNILYIEWNIFHYFLLYWTSESFIIGHQFPPHHLIWNHCASFRLKLGLRVLLPCRLTWNSHAISMKLTSAERDVFSYIIRSRHEKTTLENISHALASWSMDHIVDSKNFFFVLWSRRLSAFNKFNGRGEKMRNA